MMQLVTPAFLCFFAAMCSVPEAATAVAISANPSQQATQDAPMIQQDSQHQSPVFPDTEMPRLWTPSQQSETSIRQRSSPSSSGADEITTDSLPALANPKPVNSTASVNTTSKNATSSTPSSPGGNREEAGHDTPEYSQKTRAPQTAAIMHPRKRDTGRSCSGNHDGSSGGSNEDMEIDTLSRQQSEHPLPTSEPPATLELSPIPSDHDLSLQNLDTSSSARSSSNALSTALVVAAMTASIVLLNTGSL